MRYTLTLTFLLGVTGLVAQPVMQYGNFPSQPVTLNWYLLADPGNITEPGSGVDQVWDFTSATWQLAGAVTLAPAVGTPYASQFPDANWVFITTPAGGASIYAYLFVDASGIQVLCGDAPMNTEVYTNYKSVLSFPFAYGASFTDTNDGTLGPDGETWTYAGAGTLLTGLGELANIVKTVRTEDGRVALWSSDVVFPCITGNSDAVNLYISGTAAIDAAEIRTVPLGIFPNPVIRDLTLTGITGAARWVITDPQGRMVLSGRTNNTNIQHVDVSVLETGSYVMIMEGNGLQQVVRFCKQ